AHDVGPVLWHRVREERVQPVRVVVLREYEPLGRDDLQDRVHRRAERRVRFQGGDERLALAAFDREAVDVARFLKLAVDDARAVEPLRALRIVVRLALADFGEGADEEWPQGTRALFVEESEPIRTGDGVGRDGDAEFAFDFARFDGDAAAADPCLQRPALERSRGGHFDGRAALGATGKERSDRRRSGDHRGSWLIDKTCHEKLSYAHTMVSDAS